VEVYIIYNNNDNSNLIKDYCTCPQIRSFSVEHKKRYFKKLAYLGVEKALRLGYRLRWFVLTESDASIEAGIDYGHEWKNMQDWMRHNFGEEMQFIWVEHLQGDEKRFNRHIIQYGLNKLDVGELERYWQDHFFSKLTGLEEIRYPGKAIRYVAKYLVKGEGDEKFVRFRHSQGWLFRGAFGFSQWHRKSFGQYPPDEHLIKLSMMSLSERLKDGIYGFYVEIKEKGLERMVAEADARFKVTPPQRIDRVRLMGETGEQLILTGE